jgi:tRNA threonylcarbamoyladenosine modification (KEOPS) complex  Pcc1 subunit
MKAECSLIFEYKSEDIAKKILNSIKVDNYDFVNSQINKNTITTNIKCNSVSSLIHTLDDLLACITIAEKIVENKK